MSGNASVERQARGHRHENAYSKFNKGLSRGDVVQMSINAWLTTMRASYRVEGIICTGLLLILVYLEDSSETDPVANKQT